MYHRKIKETEFWLTFKYSLLVILCLLVSIFYLFPRFSQRKVWKSPPIQIKIYVSDIPQTSQPKRLIKPPPARPSGFIPIPADDSDFPEEIILSDIPGTLNSHGTVNAVPPEVSAKSLLEIYPSTLGVTCKGYVRVLLLINKTGRVESIEILENTTTADTCVSLVREAAFKSQWIPAKVKNEAVNSWVVKIYKFNLKK
jgi:hypothetical protein